MTGCSGACAGAGRCTAVTGRWIHDAFAAPLDEYVEFKRSMGFYELRGSGT